jgi:uncharacterized protein
MLRLALFLLVCLAVVLWWKSRQRGSSKQAPPSTPAEAPQAESMVRCAHCGVHLPASQALPGVGGVFCSAAHREQFESST